MTSLPDKIFFQVTFGEVTFCRLPKVLRMTPALFQSGPCPSREPGPWVWPATPCGSQQPPHPLGATDSPFWWLRLHHPWGLPGLGPCSLWSQVFCLESPRARSTSAPFPLPAGPGFCEQRGRSLCPPGWEGSDHLGI